MKENKLAKIIALSCLLSFATVLQADENKIPEPFRGESPGSSITIQYTDIDMLFNVAVMETEVSSRAKASRTVANIGTLLKETVNRNTAMEGNRFFFESFDSDDKKAIISNIRENLQQLPTEAPLSYMSRHEQLAYWLNLYNITLLDELLKIYPEKNLEEEMVGNDSLLDKKLLTVSGVGLSLNDIHYNILMEKFDHDPRIIYGLYQGIIGGPNLRKQAFTSDNVYKALEDNAYEFVNSNRGTYAARSKVFRVSSLYERNTKYFPNFTQDLSKHLFTYLIGPMREKLAESRKIKANINNWNITDLYGTVRSYGGSAATNVAALLDPKESGSPVTANSVMAVNLANLNVNSGRFSPEVTRHLQELNMNRKIKKGHVEVTDYEANQSKVSEQIIK